jgi:hypothetical protein
MLTLFAVLLFAQLAVLSDKTGAGSAKDIPLVLAPAATLFAIIIILNMPLRDPALPKEHISMPYTVPTATLRTPEDNLTPWQYMTVSWMAPLIQKGMTRDMNDEDVWDLGYEFKHERLHSSFRVLQGSVIYRLLQANGMDLVRTTTLALIQLVASMF